MIQHNLTIAFRNLWKYKLQTVISVLCIAIGIVTLSFVHSTLHRHRMPSLLTQSYSDRIYVLTPKLVGEVKAHEEVRLTADMLRALKCDGGLPSVEMLATPNLLSSNIMMDCYLADSLISKINLYMRAIDPAYPSFCGFRSVVTGEVVRPLKQYEAIICASEAKKLFGQKNVIGARLELQTQLSRIPAVLTVVDVYEDLTQSDADRIGRVLYSMGNLEDCTPSSNMYATNTYVVLKEGCTPEQLKQEAASRWQPLGMNVELIKLSEMVDDKVRRIYLVQTFGRLIASLILLSSFLYFLRIQVQLFWMRRREMALRIVNGARRSHVFVLLFTEMLFIVSLAILLSVVMGEWVHQFLETYLPNMLGVNGLFSTQGMPLYSLCLGTVLLLLCAIVAWICTVRICNACYNLHSVIVSRRNGMFRNIMLGLQVVVSIFFVCGALEVKQWADFTKAQFTIPEENAHFKQSLYVDLNPAEDRDRMQDALLHLPDVALSFAYTPGAYHVLQKEMVERADVAQIFGGREYVNAALVADTTGFAYLCPGVEWFKGSADHSRCLLVQRDLYQQLCDIGITDVAGLFYPYGGEQMPVAGTYKELPYLEKGVASTPKLIMILPAEEENSYHYVLVPKSGRYESLHREALATIQQLEPYTKGVVLHNTYDYFARDIFFIHAMQTLAWLLGIVSLLLCVMSIYSTIALDTRARRKEVAIRKINGAKAKDIVRLFARVYVVLVALAVLVAVPAVCLLDSYTRCNAYATLAAALSPVMPVIVGCLTVIALIVLIVGWQIRGIMRVNPAEIIAKE